MFTYTIQEDHPSGRIALLFDGLVNSFHDTVVDAQTSLEACQKEDLIIGLIVDGINDLYRLLMGEPHKLPEAEARKAIRDEVNN